MELLWKLLIVGIVMGLLLEMKYNLVTMSVETMLHMAEGYNEQYQVHEEDDEGTGGDQDDGKKTK